MIANRAAGRAEDAVRAALAAHDSARGLADAALEPVRGGFSNHAWKAEKDGRQWFVRLGGPESATLGVDRESEHALLAAVDEAGLAPSLIACDPSIGLLVTRFIDGRPWRSEDARKPRNIERLAERLRVLHGLEPPAGVHRVNFEAQARNLEAQLGVWTAVDAPARVDREGAGPTIRTATEAGATLPRIAGSAFRLLASRRRRLALCHNDLHHLNLLDDGRRLWIVDWEYGGVGDPLFDLASFACQHGFAAEERRALLDVYAAVPAAGVEIEASELDAACTAFDYVQWLWYSLWAARHPDADRRYASRAEQLEARLTARGS